MTNNITMINVGSDFYCCSNMTQFFKPNAYALHTLRTMAIKNTGSSAYTLCLASSISQVCKSMLMGRDACSSSAVWEIQACSSSKLFWNWPNPSRAHSSWCYSHKKHIRIQRFDCTCFHQCKRLMGEYMYAVLVGWQSLTPGCPSADENRSVVRQTRTAQSPARDDPQSDGSNSQSQSFSGIIPAWTPEGSDKTTRVLLRGKKKKHSRIFRSFRSTWYTVSMATRLTFKPHSCSVTDPRSDPTRNSSVDFSSADLSHSKSPYRMNAKGVRMLQHHYSFLINNLFINRPCVGL